MTALLRVTLSDRPQLLPEVAAWYFAQWGHHVPGRTLADECERLEVFLQPDSLPMLLIAMQGDRPVAAAQLKFHERKERPERLHWLGGVYVDATQRGKGIAEVLIADLMARAASERARGVPADRSRRWRPVPPAGMGTAGVDPARRRVSGAHHGAAAFAAVTAQRARTGCGAGRSASEPSVNV